MGPRTYIIRARYKAQTQTCDDPDQDLGTLPGGKRDTPRNRAALGNPNIPPGAHPGAKGMAFAELNAHAEAWVLEQGYLPSRREDVEASIRYDQSGQEPVD